MSKELKTIFKEFQDEIIEEYVFTILRIYNFSSTNFYRLLIKASLNELEQEFNNVISQIRMEYSTLSSMQPVKLVSEGVYSFSSILDNGPNFKGELDQIEQIHSEDVKINNLSLLSSIYHKYVENLKEVNGNSLFKERIENRIAEEIFYILFINRYFKVIAFYFQKDFSGENSKISIPLVSSEDDDEFLGLIITPSEIAQLLNLEKVNFNNYLISMLRFIDLIADYTTELVILLSVENNNTRTTKSQYSLSLINAQIITKLQSGFQMLDLKNDNIRRKFDGLKYNLKKVNSVVYDLSLRNLIPNEVDIF